MIERFNKKNSKKQQILQKGDIVSFFPLYLCYENLIKLGSGKK